MRHEKANTFLNFNGAAVEILKWICNSISIYWVCVHLSAMLELKLITVNKAGHMAVQQVLMLGAETMRRTYHNLAGYITCIWAYILLKHRW